MLNIKKAYPFIIDVIGTVIFFVLFCIYLYAVLYKPAYNTRKANWFIASILIIATVFYVYRVIYTVFDSQIVKFMEAVMIHTIAIVIFALWSVIICFGVFIVMNNVTGEILAKHAYFDSLTQLYNRRALIDHPFNVDYEDELAAYVICDIDNFKAINDTYGHVFGDDILSGVAGTLKENTRISDIVIRYGGDEFMLFIPVNDKSMALNICEKLRIQIESSTFTYEEEEVKVTMSFGVYVTNNNGVNCKDCIIKADEALYLSKDKGRNRCEMMYSV